MAEVAALVNPLGIPTGLAGIDLIEATGDIGPPTDIVEDEKLILRAEKGGITDAGGFQIGFGAPGYRPGITLVTLHGGGFDHVTSQDQGGLFIERIDSGSG